MQSNSSHNENHTFRFGYVTNCLGETTIEEAVRIAEELGFDCLEVGPSVKRDLKAFRAVQSSPVVIHSFIYGRNFLSKNAKERDSFRDELFRILDLMDELDVPQLTTSTGVDPHLSLEENIEASLHFWQPIFDRTRKAGKRIALEFCPTAGNFALGPYAWRMLFEGANCPNFGLNYDPSHLIWQFIDPYQPLAEFSPSIFSVHAKDTEIFQQVLAEHGILTPYSREERSPQGGIEDRSVWWEYRIPGEGALDWARFLGELRTIGFSGAINIEHEASQYSGSRSTILEGLSKSLEYLHSIQRSLDCY